MGFCDLTTFFCTVSFNRLHVEQLTPQKGVWLSITKAIDAIGALFVSAHVAFIKFARVVISTMRGEKDEASQPLLSQGP